MSVYVRDTSSKLLDTEAHGSVGQADDRESLVLSAVQCSETSDCKISDGAKVTSGVWKIRTTVGLTCSVPQKHKSGDEDSEWTLQIFKASSQPLSVNKSNTLYSSIRSEWLSTSVAVTPPAQGTSPLPQLSNSESWVVDVEDPTHFDDWLKRFEISRLCAAP
jgi:hypothetical protein